MKSVQAVLPKMEYTRAEFAALHFAPNEEYVGFVHLFAKSKKNGGQFYKILSIEADQLSESIDTFKFWNQDYYLSANSFVGFERNLDQLFTLHNIVIDVDCHDKNLSEDARNHLINAFEYFLRNELFYDKDFILPNTLAKTGRGVQLWWALKPASKWKSKEYEMVRDSLISKIQNLIESAESLAGLAVDTAASRNAAGVYRVPGTYNSNTREKGVFYLIHSEKLDLIEAAACCIPHTNTMNKVVYMERNGTDSLSVALYRHAKIHELLAIRRTERQSRDLFVFCLYNIWGRVVSEHEEILKKVFALNNRFEFPLKEREIRTYLSTSNKKRYRLSNQKIIDLLQITSEEQTLIGFYPGGQGKNSRRESERQAARNKKAQRNRQIIELVSKGYSQIEIAQKIGCSAATVSRFLAKNQKTKSLRQKVYERAAQGKKAKDIAKELACSVSVVYTYLTDFKSQKSGSGEDTTKALREVSASFAMPAFAIPKIAKAPLYKGGYVVPCLLSSCVCLSSKHSPGVETSKRSPSVKTSKRFNY